MGYNSSPILTILLTLFNLRLGWWLGNPGPAGKTRFRNAEPTWSLGPFLAEALGRTNDDGRYVYLSDGGHFENLGIYEMVRRRCHFILVSDATADSSYDFSDLGNAIQKIRVDQGIEIKFAALSDIRKYSGPSSETNDRTKAYAIGHIDYRAVDGNSAPIGIILYIKPTLSGDEPTDVLNYWSCHRDFPHESTANQWFNESRFESYRALGFHILKSIANQQRFIGNNCPPAKWAKGFDRLAKRAAGR